MPDPANSSRKPPISIANIKVKAYSLVAFLNAITSPDYSYKSANKNPITSRFNSGSDRIHICPGQCMSIASEESLRGFNFAL